MFYTPRYIFHMHFEYYFCIYIYTFQSRMSVGTRPTLVIHPTVGGTGEPLSPTGSTPGLSASTGNPPHPPNYIQEPVKFLDFEFNYYQIMHLPEKIFVDQNILDLDIKLKIYFSDNNLILWMVIFCKTFVMFRQNIKFCRFFLSSFVDFQHKAIS